jgi:hypothetical protein
MIAELYLPPKPAIIRPAEFRRGSFLPGWMPAATERRPAEITFRTLQRNTADDPPWNFNNIAVGAAHPSRYALIYAEPTQTTLSLLVNGETATSIFGQASQERGWHIHPIPTGTEVDVSISGTSIAVSGTCILWTILYLKSIVPVDHFAIASSSTNPKSTTISVQKGGVVAAF